MTSSLDDEMPLSRLTIGGLEDLGYSVNYDVADDYAPSDINSACLCSNDGGGDRRRLGGGGNDLQAIFDFPHGHAIPLKTALRGNHGAGRNLSRETREYAISYGKALLAGISKKQQKKTIDFRHDDSDEELMFVGNHAAAIVVRGEDDNIYGVVVHSGLE